MKNKQYKWTGRLLLRLRSNRWYRSDVFTIYHYSLTVFRGDKRDRLRLVVVIVEEHVPPSRLQERLKRCLVLYVTTRGTLQHEMWSCATLAVTRYTYKFRLWWTRDCRYNLQLVSMRFKAKVEKHHGSLTKRIHQAYKCTHPQTLHAKQLHDVNTT